MTAGAYRGSGFGLAVGVLRMKLPLKKEISPEEKRLNALKTTYTELIGRLNDIRTLFDYATDSEIIDALIFEENAVLSRLEGLYKEARSEGLSLEAYDTRKG